MYPKWHVTIGGVISLFIYLLFPDIGILNCFIIFLASFLIDTDHYFYYIYRTRDFSLMNAYEWFKTNRLKAIKMSEKERNTYKKSIFFFHGIECWILILLLNLISPLFQYVLYGVFIHMILDYIELSFLNQEIHHKISTFYTIIKNKNKKNWKY